MYPVIYGLDDGEDWNDEKAWYKANPSLGYTIQIDRVRDAHREALTNPAEENVFRQLRLDQWVGSSVAWIGFNGLVGFSPIAMMKNALGTTLAVEKYGSAFFKNGAQPAGVLEHPGVLKDPQKIRDNWMNA